ncbi:CorA family divalent cation transporter [uncultured Campylobacter sp.]|uniref:CorA family divalent cation transporter n=1 Tax=uncultured Campylobacter sp. TaxID=218934 RepID=UPI002601C15C|nr:CorA family divalent cation transporter [uncultured Campylobacter sp.]
MNPITEKRSVSGYYYAEDREYVYFVTDAPREQNYRFIFDAGAIYLQEGAAEVRLSSEEEFFAVVKKILAQYRDKILEHSAELENYEKIYTRRGDFSKFMKKHSILKYEIRKFQNKISHFYEALLICANEQPALKKRLKNYAYEAGVFKGVMSEYAVRIEDIYQFIQGLKNDKISRNIYILTIISSLLLPLNFITSFFGMNTTGLFLSDSQHGTLIVTLAMCVIFAAMVGFFIFYVKKRN